jgi:hypothetical protein
MSLRSFGISRSQLPIEQMTGDPNSSDESVHARAEGNGGELAESDAASLNETAAENSATPAAGTDGAATLSGAPGGQADAVSDFALAGRAEELSASQAGQFAALEALLTSMAEQQKQMLDLIARAVADNANTQAALAELQRLVEQSGGRNQNEGRLGMQ